MSFGGRGSSVAGGTGKATSMRARLAGISLEPQADAGWNAGAGDLPAASEPKVPEDCERTYAQSQQGDRNRFRSCELQVNLDTLTWAHD